MTEAEQRELAAANAKVDALLLRAGGAEDRAEAAERDRDKYRAALDELDAMKPDDFMGGQDHLPPAFREVDFKAAFRQVCRIVNRVLHNTDENGRPLDPETRAVTDGIMAELDSKGAFDG
jgi:hypothetical protein